MKYTVQKGPMLNTEMIIRDDDDGQRWFIPPDEGNRDYQEYLLWVAQGNTAPIEELT